MSENSNIEAMSISDLFDKAWSIQAELELNNDSNCKLNYEKWKLAISYLEKCELMLDEIHLFSDNESLDEVSTNELRYFLSSAMLAWLLVQSFNLNNRLANLVNAKSFYLKFFKLTKDYELHSYKIPTESHLSTALVANAASSAQQSLDSDLISMAYERNEKIKRFREQKELEKLLASMKLATKSSTVDEELKRDYRLKLIKFWINKSIDDFRFLLDELKLLSPMNDVDKKREQEEKEKQQSKLKNPAPMKPYIITRDAIQAQVFGAGYPSLPVYSVEDFYDHLASQKLLPDHVGETKLPVQIGGGVTDSQKEQDKIEKEKLIDDDEELKKQRDWDDWKDDHKKGEGNRYNRS